MRIFRLKPEATLSLCGFRLQPEDQTGGPQIARTSFNTDGQSPGLGRHRTTEASRHDVRFEEGSDADDGRGN